MITAQWEFFWPLLYVAFIPWVKIIIRPKSEWKRIVISTLLMGWLSTYFFFGWAATEFSIRFDLHHTVGAAAFILLGVITHSQFALTALLLRFLSKKIPEWILLLFIFPISYAFFEAFVPHFLGEKIGYGVYPSLAVSQLAALGSVSWITYWIMLNNAFIGKLVQLYQKKSKRLALTGLGIGCGIHLLVFFWGQGLAGQWNDRWEKSPAAMKVTIVPGIPVNNFEQARKRRAESIVSDAQEYLFRWTDQALKSGFSPDVIIWPESAVPFPVKRIDPQSFDAILKKQKKWNIPLLFGGFRSSEKGRFFNSVFQLSPGQPISVYDKMNLVPLAEDNFAPGEKPAIFDVGMKWGILICYDGQIESLARDYAKKGADLLAVFSDNSSMGKTPIPEYQFRFLVFRAIETRLPVLHAATLGFTGLISPSGKILSNIKYQPGREFVNLELRKAH